MSITEGWEAMQDWLVQQRGESPEIDFDDAMLIWSRMLTAEKKLQAAQEEIELLRLFSDTTLADAYIADPSVCPRCKRTGRGFENFCRDDECPFIPWDPVP